MSAGTIDIADSFSTSYPEARSRFQQAARQFGWQLATWNRGTFDGVPLTTDVATWGPEAADHLLLTSSGLHGIEGFFGSAMQLQLFPIVQESAATLNNTRVVQIHALNPYGFAALRRFDEQNIDQNRNFLARSEDYQGAPELYAQLNPFLNPTNWPRRELPFRVQAILTIMRFGLPALRDAIARGQYEYPQGLFYGGDAPCSTYELLKSNLTRWLGNSRDVLHLDFHTGLGTFGEYELYADHPLTDLQ